MTTEVFGPRNSHGLCTYNLTHNPCSNKPPDGKDVVLLHLIVAPLAVAELLATKEGPTHACSAW